MVFTGFQHQKLPEYEVVTPQTNESFMVRSLTVQEEEHLKSSLVTPLKITEHLNKCIYDVITQAPEHIKSYDDFLKNVTLRDRECLLFGIYHISYDEIRNYDVICNNPNCGRSFSVTIKASSTFNMNPFPEDGILKKRVNHQLPVFTNVLVVLKQPTLKDEINGLSELGSRVGSNTNQVINILPISGIYEMDENGELSQNIEDLQDIMDAYQKLPSRDKKSINERYTNEFGNYGIDLRMRATCQFCATDQEVSIDIIENFFSTIYSD